MAGEVEFRVDKLEVIQEQEEVCGEGLGRKEAEEDAEMVTVGLGEFPSEVDGDANVEGGAEAEVEGDEQMDVDVDVGVEDDDDYVVREIDVYFNSKTDENTQMYLMQYPLRSSGRPYDLEERCKEVRVKPKSAKVEMDIKVDVDSRSDHERFNDKNTITQIRVPPSAAAGLFAATAVRRLRLRPPASARDRPPSHASAHEWAAVRYLRSAVFAFLHRIPDDGLSDLVGCGLASLIFLAEQLKVNIACSKELKDELNGSDCVVCLCELRKGERLRRLECRHVFHGKCLDSWLKQLHFTCPLCRSPVPTPAASTSMESDLISWFGFR